MAKEISVALNTLHTKIFGYAVTYCDLHLGQIMKMADGHFTLLDFGIMAVHPKSQSDDQLSLAGSIFDRSRHFCRAVPNEDPNVLSLLPYGESVDWRQLGMLIYDAVMGHGEV